MPFFNSMGFHLPARKGVPEFLQEVTSRKDQAVCSHLPRASVNPPPPPLPLWGWVFADAAPAPLQAWCCSSRVHHGIICQAYCIWELTSAKIMPQCTLPDFSQCSSASASSPGALPTCLLLPGGEMRVEELIPCCLHRTFQQTRRNAAAVGACRPGSSRCRCWRPDHTFKWIHGSAHNGTGYIN